MATKAEAPKQVEAFVHQDASRKNLPTAEFQSVMREEEQRPVRVAYARRNPDLDPQLIWRGKYPAQDADLTVPAPPLYIQEKVNPKAIVDDLRREAGRRRRAEAEAEAPSLFADPYTAFNGLPSEDAKTEFYRHDAHWSNRMILGDSLQVMASLAEREGLRGKVQCIYLDPPYGIRFNSNFQWSTTSRDVKDGNVDHITREPEQVKAFRDTWRDGIHSYLTYLRDRLTVARELLTESGSIFVQIGDENVHRVRAVMDEVFGDGCFVLEIVVKKKGSQKSSLMDPVNDFILWYSKTPRAEGHVKARSLYEKRELDSETVEEFSRLELTSGGQITLKKYKDAGGQIIDFRAVPRRIETEFPGGRLFRPWPVTNGGDRKNQSDAIDFEGQLTSPPRGRCWSHISRPDGSGLSGMERLKVSGRLLRIKNSLDFKRYLNDFAYKTISNWWDGFGGASEQVYVVQTSERIVERCLLLASDPGDLILDPTCGSGTTAYVAEQWGRRWITIDTSRVALALARARVMGARYPYYLLADSPEGQRQEAKLQGRAPSDKPTRGLIREGFVYRHTAYITSGSIANNAEIDVIYDDHQTRLEPLRAQINQALGQSWEEWQIPREADKTWPGAAQTLHADWWREHIARQKAIDKSIAAKAEQEFLYDKPYEDRRKVRVAGPFTVESLSPHRVLAVDEDDRLREAAVNGPRDANDFTQVMLDTLRVSGVQQAHKEDRITFSSLMPWPGERMICAEGRYEEADGSEKRAGILIGPEFGTVTRPNLVAAAKEAGEAGFDVLIACAFAYDAQSADILKLGRVPVLKARMNADLHMATDLKNTGKGNLFVIFGEPDIEVTAAPEGLFQVRVRGVDVFQPSTGEVRSSGPEGIACWFLDTDYNEESFFVRHAYFLGASDPYKSLKTTLKAEIDEEAWASLVSDTSRPFPPPESGRIAVKVINHLGDEVMKVLRVS